ncbi:Secreted RxLR effector peptide protein [Phytophthora palmivora]|uniref:RxLR effector protein n=1 Tax=Phytophthora palmivora TaxID=4796 RepID=A0A2P4X085_9STRA|nr:Secreted RxLR effector peptide protein [Phytophthora palmivora]
MRVSIILLIIAAAYPTQGNARIMERIPRNTIQMTTPHSIESFEGIQHVDKRLLRTERDNEDNAEERVNWKGIFYADEEAWNKNDKEALDVFEIFLYYQKKWPQKRAMKMADRFAKYLDNPSAYH